ncbi:MAG: hypothetical protein VW268_09440 [Rhodospirillaceae bacterium]
MNSKNDALGLYQMTDIALKQAGLKDENTGQWTGKYGIKCEANFLNNPTAQEQAASDLHREHGKQLRNNGAWTAAQNGQKIWGIRVLIAVTESGLLAAAHP